jgi:hypothetical protein
LADEKGLYEDLRVAFGKKGVPAMIIEAAIPEIEDEANTLLSRITAGRMHVRFDTLRETVKGEAVETLDIKIADELGTRPYEILRRTVRVNFAIRIAQQAAAGAGASVATLVMDEAGQLMLRAERWSKSSTPSATFSHPRHHACRGTPRRLPRRIKYQDAPRQPLNIV